MLAREYRLPAADIRRVLSRGKRLQIPTIHLVFLPNRLPISRFAFVVSTKIDKRATVRNRIRRLLSESVRILLPTLAPGHDVVFVVRQKDVGNDMVQAKPNVEHLLRTAGL